MRGGEKAMGGGRKETAGRAGVKGAGVATGRVAGGVPAVPTEGGEMEGGGHGRPGALPRLLVKEDGVYLGVSDFFLYYYYFFFLLTIFLGKEGRSAGPAPLPIGGV